MMLALSFRSSATEDVDTVAVRANGGKVSVHPSATRASAWGRLRWSSESKLMFVVVLVLTTVPLVVYSTTLTAVLPEVVPFMRETTIFVEPKAVCA